MDSNRDSNNLTLHISQQHDLGIIRKSPFRPILTISHNHPALFYFVDPDGDVMSQAPITNL